MLLAEYDYETDIAVQRAEEREIAFAEGIERGIERGIEQGIERGFEQGIEQGIERGIERGFSEGSYQTKRETAVAFKRLGIDIAKIAEGTGLSVEEIEKL